MLKHLILGALWKLRCGKHERRCGAKHIYNKIDFCWKESFKQTFMPIIVISMHLVLASYLTSVIFFQLFMLLACHQTYSYIMNYIWLVVSIPLKILVNGKDYPIYYGK